MVKANGLKSCYFRPMAFYGSGKLGVAPKKDDASDRRRLAVGAHPGRRWPGKGIRVKTSSFTRHHVNITMCKAKANGNCMNSILANNEATADGYDEAAAGRGRLWPKVGENIFIIRKGKIVHPDLTSALEGITATPW